MATNLKDVCTAIKERHNNAENKTFQCIVCQNVMRGSDALMTHSIEFHGVILEHFDNIADLDGMLAMLNSVLRKDDAHLTCPVCSVLCADEVDLKDHCDLEEHRHWNHVSIPALKRFMIPSIHEGADDDEDADQSAAAAAAQDEPNVEEGDLDDEDEEVQEATCLYCPAVCRWAQLEGHLKDIHGLDMKSYILNHRDMFEDEYALIRTANYVRECCQALMCPHGADCTQSIASQEEWTEHVCHAKHFFPSSPSQAIHERYLIPRIPGDMFLAFLLECDWLDDEEEDASMSYPMIDTVQQLAAKHRHD